MRCSLMRRYCPGAVPRGRPPSVISRSASSSARSSASSGALKVISCSRVHDIARAGRRAAALERIDLHDQHVLGRRRAQERQHRRVAAVAAVPIGHAVDLHRLEQQRQAGRRHHDFRRHLGAREHALLAAVDVGGGNEQLAPRVAAHQREIDEALDQALERIDVERIEIVGRPVARQRAEPRHRRALPRHEREQPLDRFALQLRQRAAEARRAPEIGEPLPRLLRPAAREPVGEHHRVHGAGGGAGDAVDGDPPVGQQLVEHAPGEGAMRPAALEGEVDGFGRLRESQPARPGHPGPAHEGGIGLAQQDWKHHISCGLMTKSCNESGT